MIEFFAITRDLYTLIALGDTQLYSVFAWGSTQKRRVTSVRTADLLTELCTRI
jgi:hypothetical protein